MSITKTPPKRFYELLDQIVEHEKGTKDCFDEAVELLQKKGWNNEEIAMVMHDYLRDKINSKTLQRWIKPLKPIEESTSQSGTLSDNDAKNDTEQEDETPPEITVTTEGSQTATPIELPTVPREPITPVDFKEEDPQALEIQFLKEKVTELEDALKKTQQFTPATQLQQQQEPATDEHYFKWLTDKADGIHSFYYDSYGIDLFKNRELSQLKNSGVKVFKRLYFEV